MSERKGRGMTPSTDLLNQAAGRRGPTPEERYKSAGDVEPPAQRGRMAFGPPDFGDEEEQEPQQRQFHDPNQTRQAWGDFGPPDLDGDGDDEDFDQQDFEPELEEEYDGPGFNPPQPWQGVQEYPTPPSFRQRGGAMIKDEPLFPGGPMRSEINAWKKQFETEGHSIHMSEPDEDNIFIWRTLSRTEYREIMALPNTDPLQREEIICEVCVLYPIGYNFATMANRKAGVPAVIAEQIMHESGFKRPTPPTRL